MPSTRSYRNGVRIAAEQRRNAPTRKQVWLAPKLCNELSLPYPRGLGRQEMRDEIALLCNYAKIMGDKASTAGPARRQILVGNGDS